MFKFIMSISELFAKCRRCFGGFPNLKIYIIKLRTKFFKVSTMSMWTTTITTKHNCLHPSSFKPPFSRPLAMILSLFLIGTRIALHCTCQNNLNWFSLVLSSIGATSNFQWMPSFLTLSLGVLPLFHFGILISATSIFWTMMEVSMQHKSCPRYLMWNIYGRFYLTFTTMWMYFSAASYLVIFLDRFFFLYCQFVDFLTFVLATFQ